MDMINAKDVVIWINDETREVMVRPHSWGRRRITRDSNVSTGLIQSVLLICNGIS
jgi:hypothetical protein